MHALLRLAWPARCVTGGQKCGNERAPYFPTIRRDRTVRMRPVANEFVINSTPHHRVRYINRTRTPRQLILKTHLTRECFEYFQHDFYKIFNKMLSVDEQQPISRTYQYRKVMKPMLERKRRARINRCLDELKELMVTALQSEGENVSKLEKADILELTVRHLHKLRRQQRLASNPVIDADRFRAGYTHCANEVSRCLAAIPGVDVQLGTKLMTHLGHRLNEMDKVSPLQVQVPSPYTPPGSPNPDFSTSYNMPLTPASSTPLSPSDASSTSGLLKVAQISSSVWRPW